MPDAELRAAIVAECPPDAPGPLRRARPRARGAGPAPRSCGYLSFTYEDDAAEAERRGWIVGRAEGHHLQPAVDPDGVADQLALLLGALGVAP